MGARRLAGFTAAAALALPAAAQAAPATPDTTFGPGGVVATTALGPAAGPPAMALDAAGRVVLAARADASLTGLVRIAPDGTADDATNPAAAISDPRVIEQPGEGYLVGGWVATAGGRSFALARFTTGGAADGGFGLVSATPGGTEDELRALTLLPDGRILAAGRSDDRVGIVTYGADGGGAVGQRLFLAADGTTPIGDAEVSAALVDAGAGRILLAGTATVAGERRLLLIALRIAGGLDPGFGGDGVVTLGVGDGDTQVTSIARQADGALLVGGTTAAGGGGGGFVARFTAGGTLDTGFGGDGIARLGVGGGRVAGLALQADGKILAAGAADYGTSGSDSLIARFRPGGALDPGFGAAGIVRRDLGGGGADDLAGVGPASGGRIVAGGSAGSTLTALRLVGGDSSDPAIAVAAETLGDLVTFTISATNPGADPARDVRVAVTPPGTRTAAAALGAGSGGCTGYTCAVGTIPPGGVRRVTLLARAKAPGPLTTTARVGSSTYDSNPLDNVASATGVAGRNRVVHRDITPPRVKVRIKARRLRDARRRLKLAVHTSERAGVRLRTQWNDSGRARSLARNRTVHLRKKGTKVVRLKLTTAGRRELRRKRLRKLELAVTARARDRVGNIRVKRFRKTLHRR
jgi:uncharacterized delta-60 repeat protein/uncharacterized repeat protein (TIGR01451 family)